MADTVPIVVPNLGRSVAQARIRRWLKNTGETVLAFEPLVEVETDRATIELHAPTVGTLSSVSAGPGEIVTVGAEIGAIKQGLADTTWTVYREAPWRSMFPLLSQIATWLGWKR
jgi:pyruvate/2-oxoglutarate dehydrogenase complex dihydrolipoamide acyltransferase (E2) component